MLTFNGSHPKWLKKDTPSRTDEKKVAVYAVENDKIASCIVENNQELYTYIG